MLIPLDAKVNTFGGFKCKCGDYEIDVWPGDLGALMQNQLAKHAWHPRSGARLVKI
jgi:hypothetical protein